MHPLLSVVIPLYNEERRLMDGFTAIHSYLSSKPYPWEIILVDDGSVDRTAEMLRNITVRYTNTRMTMNEQNRGKGSAVKKGMLAAHGDIIVFTDIDLSVPIAYIDAFVAKISEGCDIAIGSRKIEGATLEIRQSPLREFMSRMFTRMSNLLLGIRFPDHTCGMKAFTKPAAHTLFSRLRTERWAFDSEILFLSKLLGYKVMEVAVLWRHMPGTKVRLFFDALRSFWEIAKIRFYHTRTIR